MVENPETEQVIWSYYTGGWGTYEALVKVARFDHRYRRLLAHQEDLRHGQNSTASLSVAVELSFPVPPSPVP